MKRIELVQLENLIGGDGNCRGIYESCLNVSLVAGGIMLFGTGPFGIIFGTLTGYAGMEYCRQQYLGCH
jgi:hypothetical protein